MHEFTVIDLAGLVACGLVIAKILGPVAKALAKRLEGAAPAPLADDSPVYQLRDELEELQERVDFLERALASRQPPAELPRPRTPV